MIHDFRGNTSVSASWAAYTSFLANLYLMKVMITKNQSIVLAMVASLAVALSGCGGGGGGGGGSSGGGSSIAPTRSLALEDPITATHTAGAISRAAEAEPRAGSVTLSYCFIQKLASLGVI